MAIERLMASFELLVFIAFQDIPFDFLEAIYLCLLHLSLFNFFDIAFQSAPYFLKI
jgi:hypothetical protein